MQNKLFVPNQKNRHHSLQACYLMTVNSLTSKNLSMKQAEIDTGYEKNGPNWDFQALLGLARHDLKVTVVGEDDYQAMADDFMVCIDQEGFSPEEKEDAINMTKMSVEEERIKKILNNPNIKIFHERPKLKRLLGLINDNILIASIEKPILNHHKNNGYYSRFVIIKFIEDDYVIIDYPGPPAKENCKIPLTSFLNDIGYVVAVSR